MFDYADYLAFEKTKAAAGVSISPEWLAILLTKTRQLIAPVCTVSRFILQPSAIMSATKKQPALAGARAALMYTFYYLHSHLACYPYDKSLIASLRALLKSQTAFCTRRGQRPRGEYQLSAELCLFDWFIEQRETALAALLSGSAPMDLGLIQFEVNALVNPLLQERALLSLKDQADSYRQQAAGLVRFVIPKLKPLFNAFSARVEDRPLSYGEVQHLQSLLEEISRQLKQEQTWMADSEQALLKIGLSCWAEYRHHFLYQPQRWRECLSRFYSKPHELGSIATLYEDEELNLAEQYGRLNASKPLRFSEEHLSNELIRMDTSQCLRKQAHAALCRYLKQQPRTWMDRIAPQRRLGQANKRGAANKLLSWLGTEKQSLTANDVAAVTETDSVLNAIYQQYAKVMPPV